LPVFENVTLYGDAVFFGVKTTVCEPYEATGVAGVVYGLPSSVTVSPAGFEPRLSWLGFAGLLDGNPYGVDEGVGVAVGFGVGVAVAPPLGACVGAAVGGGVDPPPEGGRLEPPPPPPPPPHATNAAEHASNGITERMCIASTIGREDAQREWRSGHDVTKSG
jgi:hypothetical protein